MSKHIKNKKFKRSEYISPEQNLKLSLSKIKWKRLLKLILSFIVIFSVYQTAIYFEFPFIMPIYYAALIVLVLAYVFINKGIPKRGEDKARTLLLFIIPLIWTFLFDLVYVMYIME